MKRRAQLGFNAQCLLHNHTDTVPSSVQKFLKVDEVVEDVRKGKPMAEDLHNILRNNKISVPLVGESNERRSDEDITVFLVSLAGTIQSLPFTNVLRQKALDGIHKFCVDSIPKNEKVMEVVHAAGKNVPELKPVYEEAAATNFKNIYANERLQQAFGDFMAKEIASKNKNSPYVNSIEGALFWDLGAGTGLKFTFFNDVKPFFEVAGRKKTDNEQVHTEKNSCIAIYSSASKMLQQTLLSNAQDGDLSTYVTEYIETSFAGSKLMPKSYSKIRSHMMQLLGDNIKLVFITGNSSEATAAETSGDVDCTILCLRPCNEWLTIDTFVAVNLPQVVSLSQIIQPELPVDFGALAAEAVRSSAI